jgi:outer membrane protein assembly factor BamB
MRRALCIATSAALACLVLTIPAGAYAASPTGSAVKTFVNWGSYLFGPAHSSANSAAVAITPATAPTLARAWQWVPDPPTRAGQPPARLLSSPAVVDGRVYIGAGTGVFYALDEATGRVLWHRFLGFVTRKTCAARGFSSTATVARDPRSGTRIVYVAAADGYLYALRAASGTIKWRSVVGLPSRRVNNYYNWSSPTVVNGRIYIGVSSECDAPLVAGGLKEYSQATGALLHFYRTNPGHRTGPSIWSSAAVNSPGKSVFVTTGNGAGRSEVSVIRLSATSLAKKDSWQIPPGQRGADSDFGGSPTLFSATLGGASVPLVGACNKNGFYYVLRRDNLAAGPVWRFKAGSSRCDAAAAWDGTNLFVASDRTVIGGVAYQGAVRLLDPATGSPRWQLGLPGPVVGSPALDGAGVLAVPTYSGSGLFLIAAATGTVLRNIATFIEFGQPVFADDMMLVPTEYHGLWAYRPAAG